MAELFSHADEDGDTVHVERRDEGALAIWVGNGGTANGVVHVPWVDVRRLHDALSNHCGNGRSTGRPADALERIEALVLALDREGHRPANAHTGCEICWALASLITPGAAGQEITGKATDG